MTDFYRFTAAELAKERQARADREELFRRICDEAEASSCTFEQAASRLGIPPRVVLYFQTEHAILKGFFSTKEL